MSTTSMSNPGEVTEQTLKGLRYTRAIGVATGAFLIGWIPFNASRWMGQAPGGLLELEALYFMIFGVMLMLPWSRIQSPKAWKPLFIIFCVLTLGFGFLMVVDLMFLYMLAAGAGQKIAPPAFQSLLLFTALIQAPTVYFVRKPHALN
ncbi:hypothetical protein [Cerasicoccus fimbriatus]|uniref:hypothetical protein n=1 Tax=Cerasicoccus fimbriatus TaxID=3014554 RepID=UPI0022B3E8DC|nr:hypothetical protein [Cerasicoccus sp. TK19100]